ncbi:unnamed protein product [Linum tenue]|uniref:Uncharacterized protein n=1 Tax=Linum tenue TaxID=586396 RepID=A0AAV0I6W6_9ROSI|nr:unnamed protein product [Linum tenue]
MELQQQILRLQLGRNRVRRGPVLRTLPPPPRRRPGGSHSAANPGQALAAQSPQPPLQPPLRRDPVRFLQPHSPPQPLPSKQRLLRRFPRGSHSASPAHPARPLVQQLHRPDSVRRQQLDPPNRPVPREQRILRPSPFHLSQVGRFQRLQQQAQRLNP